MPDQHVFLTGFPGFIARRLVRDLLSREEGTRVTALVEAKMAAAAREAADATGFGERIELVAGDIVDRRLGLGDDYDAIAKRTDTVFHLAAIYDLAVPIELAQRVNVDGTGNVLDFCAAAQARRHVYVSTAYVAGTRRGVVYEHELVMGQGFKNHYESTKFQAEAWVRDRMGEVPTVICRPAIVVGDSKTGETQKFDGPYYLLRSISRAVRLGQPVAQFGRAEANFNVVPVDFVVEALLAAAKDDRADGETLHLVDPEPLSAAELTRVLSAEYGGVEPKLTIPASLVQESLRLKKVRDLFEGAPRESIRYLNHPVRFDTRQADDLLGRNGLECPRFPDYAGPIVSFFKEHEADPALRPKPTSSPRGS